MSSNGNEKNVLIVSQYFFPTSDNDYKIKEDIEKLTNQGYKISLIVNKSKSDNSVEINNANIYYIEQEKPTAGSEWAYIINNIIFMWKAIKLGSSLKDNFDMVIATIPSSFAGIAARIIAGNKKTKYYINIKENWVDSALKNEYITNGGPIHKASIMIENWLNNNSEKFTL